MYVLFMDHTFPILTCPSSKYYFVKEKCFLVLKLRLLEVLTICYPQKSDRNPNNNTNCTAPM